MIAEKQGQLHRRLEYFLILNNANAENRHFSALGMLKMGIPRTLNLQKLLDKKSFFLFGPRSTGKSTLIKEQLSGTAQLIDLLDGQTFLHRLWSGEYLK